MWRRLRAGAEVLLTQSPISTAFFLHNFYETATTLGNRTASFNARRLSMSLLHAMAIQTNMLLGLVSLISGMFIGLILGSVCWYFMKKADRGTKLSVLWLFLVWGALWIGQGLQEPIKRILGG